MAKLPDLKRVLREDIKDAPDWINVLLYPFNAFVESIYQALNKQLTFQENIACSIRDVEFSTSASYPSSFTQIKAPSGIKSKVQGVLLVQITEKASNYTSITGSPFVNWLDVNGDVIINHISGLAASKTYQLRILIF